MTLNFNSLRELIHEQLSKMKRQKEYFLLFKKTHKTQTKKINFLMKL